MPVAKVEDSGLRNGNQTSDCVNRRLDGLAAALVEMRNFFCISHVPDHSLSVQRVPSSLASCAAALIVCRSFPLVHLIFSTCHFFLFHSPNPPSPTSPAPSFHPPSPTRLPDPSPPHVSPLTDPFRLIPIFSLIVIKSHSVSSWQECEICQGKAIKVTADWNRLGEQQGKWREGL